ncbi:MULTISPECIES: hypothetical protein [unclassified Crossiella]|uniref:hypothetical protein n=1 Tax=unclassified Crossiella TaxID=2620835 RepID=UPI001FFE7D43|nr:MULTISPECIES: hypothetical protein [unclassified Crossiella]MCK2237700.1 hypothetical protein [Crossiella sp. S99.2]MCK2254986.1 hypothetical protein [Crossiella sp. S99.1]
MPLVPSADDVLSRLRRLESRVEELSRTTLSNAVISDGGITVRNLGGIRALDSDENENFFIGGLDGTLSRPDGTPQPAFLVSDDRGAWRITLFDPAPDRDDYRQFVSISDFSGNTILGDDVVDGQGLARPYMAVPFSRSRVGDYPAVTSSAFEAVWEATVLKQQPKLSLWTVTGADAGTVGEFEIKINGQTVQQWQATGGYGRDARGPYSLPGLVYRDLVRIELRARRVSGTGTVRVSVGDALGRQS